MKKLLFILFAFAGIVRADTGDIPLSSNFQENSGRSLDARTTVNDSTARLALPSIGLYDGLMVYQRSDHHIWQLQGSTYTWIDITNTPGVNIQNTNTLQQGSTFYVNHGVTQGNMCIGRAISAGGTFVTTSDGHLDASTLENPLPAISGSLLYSLNPQSLNGEFNSIQVNTPEPANMGAGQPLWVQPDASSIYMGWQSGFNSYYSTGGYNTGYGYSTFFLGPTGQYNTGIGGDACYSMGSGTSNAGVGWASLEDNTSGSYNSALGLGSLQLNLTGSGNVSVGTYSMFNSTSTSNNVAIGYQALESPLSTEAYDVAVGYNSLNGATSGTGNTALGYSAAEVDTTGSYNTALGLLSLESNTTGGANTAVGANSMLLNTTGNNNVAVGEDALLNNLNGSQNIAIGQFSLLNSTNVNNDTMVGYNTGQTLNWLSSGANSALGFSALGSATGGSYDSAVGISALGGLTTGIQDTAIGAYALSTQLGPANNSAVGYASLYDVTTGGNNTGIGASTGYNVGGQTPVTTGAYNTFLGYGAGWSGAGQPTNSIAIGNQAAVSVSSAAQIGGVVGSGLEVDTIVSTLTIAGIASGVQCLEASANGRVIGTGAACGSGGGGASGTIVAAPQFNLPYYSLSGTTTTVAGASGITTDGVGALTISTLTTTSAQIGSASSTNGPNGGSAFHGSYLSVASSGTTGGILVEENGQPGGGGQTQQGGITIRNDANPAGPPSTLLVLVDSTTDLQSGTALLDIYQLNPLHNDPTIWVHKTASNSGPEIRDDAAAPNWEFNSTSSDTAHGRGKWETDAVPYQSEILQVNSRAWDNTTYENVAYWEPLDIEPSDAYPGLYLRAQDLTDDSGVLQSSQTAGIQFFTLNGHTVGLQGPTNATASWDFQLPNTYTNAGQVLYQATNSSPWNWAFTSGGSSGQVLTNEGTSPPQWTTVSGGSGGGSVAVFNGVNYVSSPTAVINFSSPTFVGTLTGSATAQINIAQLPFQVSLATGVIVPASNTNILYNNGGTGVAGSSSFSWNGSSEVVKGGVSASSITSAFGTWLYGPVNESSTTISSTSFPQLTINNPNYAGTYYSGISLGFNHTQYGQIEQYSSNVLCSDLSTTCLATPVYINGDYIDANGKLAVAGYSQSTATIGGNLLIGANYPTITNAPLNGLRMEGSEIVDSSLTVTGNASLGGVVTIDNSKPAPTDFMLNVSSNSGSPVLWGIQENGHSVSSGTTPSAGTCGTSPAIVLNSTDEDGAITWSGGATSCAMTFGAAYNSAPFCTANSNGAGYVELTSVATTGVTFTLSASLTGGTIYWHCHGGKGG